MANRYAVQTGNWSDVNTWDGGTLPQSGDTVRPSLYVVTIDQNIEVAELNNEAFESASLGGYFVTTGSITIQSDLRPGGSGVPLLRILESNVTITIIGNTYAGSNPNSRGVRVQGTNITVNYTGNIYGGSASNSGTNTAEGFRVTGQGCVMNMTGNLYGGTNQTCFAIRCYSYSMNLNMVGFMYGVEGGAFIQGSHNFWPSGDENVGSYITGNITAISSNSGLGVALHGNSEVYADRMVIDKEVRTNGWAATLCGVSFKNNNPIIETIKANGDTLTFVDSTNFDYPSINDVREGITYNSGVSTGLLKVPNSGSVALGVPFDTGSIGTAVLTSEAIWDTQQDTLTTSGSIGERLKNVATVQTTAAQIAAF